MFAMSHHQDITDLLRRRNAANIPNDQRALLENDNSWATDLKGSVHGQAHVPGHVLQTVKEAYMLAQETGHKGRQSSANTSLNGRANSQPYHNGSPNATAEHLESSPPPHTQERLIDWSQSPERPQQSIQPQSTVESSLVQETPQAKPTMPPPKLASRPVFAPIGEFPSSDNEQEELEMEVPQAAVKASSAINLASAARRRPILSSPLKANSTQATNTPPCAQPTQPPAPISSVAEKPTEPATPKNTVPRPYRRMKPILMSDASPVPTRINRATTSFARLPAMKIYEEIESSNSTTSGSYIPSTHLDLATQKSVASPGPVRHLLPDTTQAETVVHESPTAGNPTNGDNHNKNDDNNDTGENGRGRSISEELIVEEIMPSIETAEEETPDPYNQFMTLYPTYTTEHNGSLRNFVKACVCLEFLRNERALRECLYDDFIRAFSGGYLSYVNSAGPHQEPLPAIEWFNNLPGASSFNSMAITRANLNDILESYTEEVARSRQMIEVDDEPDNQRSSPHPSIPALDDAMDVDKPELEDAAPVPVATPAAQHDVPKFTSPTPPRQAALSQPPLSQTLHLESASVMSLSPSPAASVVRRLPSHRPSRSVQRESRLVHSPLPKPAASVVRRQPSRSPSEPVWREPKPAAHYPSPQPVAPLAQRQSSHGSSEPVQHEPMLAAHYPSPKPVSRVTQQQSSHRPTSSVQLGSEPAHSPSPNPTSSAVMPQPPPRSSQYFERLSSASRPGSKTVKRRSAAEQARLREYFRKRKSSGSRTVPSSRAEV